MTGVGWDDGVEHVWREDNEEPLANKCGAFSGVAGYLVFQDGVEELEVFSVTVNDDLEGPQLSVTLD